MLAFEELGAGKADFETTWPLESSHGVIDDYALGITVDEDEAGGPDKMQAVVEILHSQNDVFKSRVVVQCTLLELTNLLEHYGGSGDPLYVLRLHYCLVEEPTSRRTTNTVQRMAPERLIPILPSNFHDLEGAIMAMIENAQRAEEVIVATIGFKREFQASYGINVDDLVRHSHTLTIWADTERELIRVEREIMHPDGKKTKRWWRGDFNQFRDALNEHSGPDDKNLVWLSLSGSSASNDIDDYAGDPWQLPVALDVTTDLRAKMNQVLGT